MYVPLLLNLNRLRSPHLCLHHVQKLNFSVLTFSLLLCRRRVRNNEHWKPSSSWLITFSRKQNYEHSNLSFLLLVIFNDSIYQIRANKIILRANSFFNNTKPLSHHLAVSVFTTCCEYPPLCANTSPWYIFYKSRPSTRDAKTSIFGIFNVTRSLYNPFPVFLSVNIQEYTMYMKSSPSI